MKTLSASILILGLAICSVSAQISSSLSLLSTNTLTGLQTNTVASTAIELPSLKEFYLYPSCRGSNSTCANVVTFVFAASPDGTNYTTTRTDWKVDVTLSGTNVVTTPAKVDATGFRFFRLSSVEHPATYTSNGIYSISVKYFSKTGYGL
jgi:hypothetical protein